MGRDCRPIGAAAAWVAEPVIRCLCVGQQFEQNAAGREAGGSSIMGHDRVHLPREVRVVEKIVICSFGMHQRNAEDHVFASTHSKPQAMISSRVSFDGSETGYIYILLQQQTQAHVDSPGVKAEATSLSSPPVTASALLVRALLPSAVVPCRLERGIAYR